MKKVYGFGYSIVFLLFILSSVSEASNLQSRIIGKWVEVDGDEKIEFLKDGTVIIVSKGFSGVGDYRFIDENRLRMNISGFWGIAGAQVFEISIDKEGHLIIKEPDGKVSEYITVEEEEKKNVIRHLLLEMQWDKLKEMGKAAVGPLIILLKDRDDKVRTNAAKALGEIVDSRAAEPLIAALKDGNPWVHHYVALALGKIGKDVVEPLISALKDGNVLVRHGAAVALGNTEDSRAVEPLIAALKDGDALVRANAAEALGKIGDSRAVEPLTATLKDKSENVRKNAAEALKKLEESAKCSTTD